MGKIVLANEHYMYHTRGDGLLDSMLLRITERLTGTPGLRHGLGAHHVKSATCEEQPGGLNVPEGAGVQLANTLGHWREKQSSLAGDNCAFTYITPDILFQHH